MKKAENILDEELLKLKPNNFIQMFYKINRNKVLNIIKQIQEDAIRETVQECVENVEIEEYDEHFQYSPHVNKNSILSIADKLIKEL